MVVVYSIALVIGVIGIIVMVVGGSFAENVGRPDRDPGAKLGSRGKTVLGAVAGFGMGGMAAEFSPLNMSWQVALVIAAIAAGIGALWVRYAMAEAERA